MADIATSVLNDPSAVTGAGDIGAELRERLARELRDGFVSRAIALPLGSQEALARVAYLCRLRGSTRNEIAREVTGRVACRIVGRTRTAMSALIVSDHSIAMRERADLVEPHAFAACEAMDQDDGLSLAEAAIVDPDVVD